MIQQMALEIAVVALNVLTAVIWYRQGRRSEKFRCASICKQHFNLDWVRDHYQNGICGELKEDDAKYRDSFFAAITIGATAVAAAILGVKPGEAESHV